MIFALDGAELSRLMDQFGAHEKSGHAGAGRGRLDLAKLRAILEVARTLQTGFSVQDVLNSVVDAALAITGAERGFLLLRKARTGDARGPQSRGAALPDERPAGAPGG